MVITTYFLSSENRLRENIRNMKGAGKKEVKKDKNKKINKNLNAKN
jgi:hypothetical protein